MRMKLIKTCVADKLRHTGVSSCLRHESSAPICFIRTLSTTLPQELLPYMLIPPHIDLISGGRQPYVKKVCYTSSRELS